MSAKRATTVMAVIALCLLAVLCTRQGRDYADHQGIGKHAAPIRSAPSGRL